MARRTVSLAAAGALACALALTSAPAHADIDFQIAVTGGVAHVRDLPTLKSETISTQLRDLSPQRVPLGGSVTALGGSFDLTIVMDAHWVVPGFGFGAYAAVGSYSTINTSIDGSIARARPWSMYMVDILLPGLGYRVTKRRFMFQAALRTGITFMKVGNTVAFGRQEEQVDLTGASVMLQAELEACRRLDPVTRVCLQLAPRIYDFGILNGATLGLRMEWGR